MKEEGLSPDSAHIRRVKRAIEFGSPDLVPMDLVDVPLLYDAYGTLDPAAVKVPPGAERFDSAWCTYHWSLRPLGCNERGEAVRRDEWGCTQVVPLGRDSAYSIIARPELATREQVRAHPWPDPAGADGFFEQRRAVIQQHYPDRFINGFLDPGPFLLAFELLGYEGMLLKLAEDPQFAMEVLRRIVDYQLALLPKFRRLGAHMVTIIDEIAGTAGMMFSPELFRRRFAGLYRELLAGIRGQGMYTSLLLDGNITDILPDLLDMDIDVQLFVQPQACGLETIRRFFRGRRAVKLAVDMMDTLVRGTAAQIQAEVDRYVEYFHTAKGGLIFQALRWHRPEYDPARVEAQIAAMNRHRKGA